MVKRKININRKSKDWKNKYPMVEIHWVDIVSDSSWQSLKQLKEHELPVCVTKGHLFSQDKGVTRVFADYSLNDKKESTPKTEGYLFLQWFPCPWFWNLGQRTTDLRCIT
jgi:hypothetical protein